MGENNEINLSKGEVMFNIKGKFYLVDIKEFIKIKFVYRWFFFKC